MSVTIAPSPKNHAWKNPFFIPVFRSVALTGPIGAAKEIPNKKYVLKEFIHVPHFCYMMHHIHEGLTIQLKRLNNIKEWLNWNNSMYLLFRIVSEIYVKMIEVS